MRKIILDLGSGTICRNDKNIVKKMIDEIKRVDTGKHTIVFKWQLFSRIPEGSPTDLPILQKGIFEYAYKYAAKNGYQTTSSFFDNDSLSYLLKFDIPFVKVACKDWLYEYIVKVPHHIPLVISVPSINQVTNMDRDLISRTRDYMFCVPKYPADTLGYEKQFGYNLSRGLSDHSVGFDLFKKYKPKVYEKHFKLDDSEGYDTGDYAATPEDLKEIL